MTTRRAMPKGLAAAVVALAATLPLLPTLRAGFVYERRHDDRPRQHDAAWMVRARSRVERAVLAEQRPGRTSPPVSPDPRRAALGSVEPRWRLPWLFHLYAVGLHLTVALLLWRLLGGAVGRVAATMGALWFATHALHVETVASVANSSELLVALFTIALAIVIARAESVEGVASEWAVALLAGALTVGAVLSKESGVFALPVAAVTAWGWRRVADAPAARTMARRHARIWVACAASLAIALLARGRARRPRRARVDRRARPGRDDAARAHRDDALPLAADRRHGRVAVGALALLRTDHSPGTAGGARRRRRARRACVRPALAAALARRGDRRPRLGRMDRIDLPAGVEPSDFGGSVHRRPDAARSDDRGRVRSRLGDRPLFVAPPGSADHRIGCADLHDASVSLRYAAVWSSHRTLWERLVQTSPAEYPATSCSASTRASMATRRARSRCWRAPSRWSRVTAACEFEYGQVLYTTARYAAAAEVLAPLLRDGDVRREPAFVAMFDAVGRSPCRRRRRGNSVAPERVGGARGAVRRDGRGDAREVQAADPRTPSVSAPNPPIPCCVPAALRWRRARRRGRLRT